jgi:hypothetical protein
MRFTGKVALVTRPAESGRSISREGFSRRARSLLGRTRSAPGDGTGLHGERRFIAARHESAGSRDAVRRTATFGQLDVLVNAAPPGAKSDDVERDIA